ncbi:MAG: peptidyl-prolyl cis-trans isomerase [Pirellulaceae bacterium]|nr:peptidyl-prolyl cis-trans isomerase [Pirellulaceae bacterium]
MLCSLIATANDTAAVPPVSGIVTVEMKTSQGVIVMELDADKAPMTVKNFIQYIAADHYKETVFHRVIDGFMIQGGGLDRYLKEKPTSDPIANESANGLKNDKYTVAMARTSDPNSATSQFFINTGENGFLNRDEAEDGYGYTVFGRVVEGQEVVDKINKAPTQVQSNPLFPAMLMRDVPVDPIMIQDMKITGHAKK